MELMEVIEADKDEDANEFWLAVLVSLPELEASEAWDGVTLNCCDWARIPPSEGETKLTW